MDLKEIDKLDLAALAKLNVDVDTLLGEDAVLDLSYNEKVVYRLFAQGVTDEECEKRTGIKKGTVTKMRYTFWQRAEYAVVFSLLAREMARGMPDKERNSTDRKPGEYHPVLDAKGIVTGFAKDKYSLHHEGDAALRHASVIILVGYLEPTSGELSFFVVDKAARMLKPNAIGDAVFPHAWETCGGHVEAQDSPGIEEGQPLPLMEAFQNAAVRELKEELYIKRTELNIDRLHYLYTDHYDGTTVPMGRNVEISGVFLYCYNGKKEDISSGDVRFRDRWRSAWLTDGMAKKEWIASPWRWTQLMKEYEKPNHFCDALARCLCAMRDDPALVDRMAELLRSQGNGE